MNVNLNVSKFFLLLCEVIQHMILVVNIEIVTRGTGELYSFGRVKIDVVRSLYRGFQSGIWAATHKGTGSWDRC